MAVPTDAALRDLLDRFVCVRLVQMWGVDLSRFQFDYAMTWAIFFMHADGTIYGRYGTRSAMRDESTRDISLEGFKRSTEAALQLHDRYTETPAVVRAGIAGKQTQHAPRWSHAEEIPELARNDRLAKKFTGFAESRSGRAHGVGCIHCHMVPNHELLSLRRLDLPIDDRLIWPYPLPGAVGMHMDPAQRATVQRVADDSAAAKAGVLAGDEIESFDGQTILSTADLQWVLHNTPSAAVELALTVRRGGTTRDLALRLAPEWRRRLGDWRFINVGVCMQIAGFNGRPGPHGREALDIRVGRVHPKRLSGVDLRKDDVIVALDGKREPMNLGQLTRYLLAKKPGSELEVTRRRPGQDGEKTLRLAID